MVHCLNNPPVKRKAPDPVWTTKENLGFQPLPPPMSLRDTLETMLTQMQEGFEQVMDELPVQPLARPACPHCVQKELNRSHRN